MARGSIQTSGTLAFDAEGDAQVCNLVSVFAQGGGCVVCVVKNVYRGCSFTCWCMLLFPQCKHTHFMLVLMWFHETLENPLI